MNKTIKILLKILLFLLVFMLTFCLIRKNRTLISMKEKHESQSEALKEKIDSLSKELQDQININEKQNQDLQINKEEKANLERELNSLKEEYLKETSPVSFNPNNLWDKSDATTSKMIKGLRNTGLEEVASVYVKAEEIWGVNAIFLASLTAEESAWGTSHRANTQNNLSGYGVYSPSSRGIAFDSKEDSIMRTAELICNDYLKPTGKYHNGLTIWDVNERYCVGDGKRWSKNIISIANSLVEKINNHN